MDSEIEDPRILPEEEGREAMAQLVAAITSGIRAALPEQEDYDLADQIIKQIEERY